MKYKMMVDECFTDKLDETIEYVPGDIIKTEINEKRKEDLITRKLAHVVEEIDTTDKAKIKSKGKKEEVEPTTDKELTTDEEIVEETTEEVEPTTDEK